MDLEPGAQPVNNVSRQNLARSGQGEHDRCIEPDPRTDADLLDTPEHRADREMHTAVLEYAQAQPDYAGSWWARSGGRLTPVVGFTRDLPAHRRRTASLPQAPGLVLVQRQTTIAELRKAGRRVLDVEIPSATLCGVSVNEKTGRVVLRVDGDLNPEDLRLLTDRIGHEPEIRPGGRARRRPWRGTHS